MPAPATSRLAAALLTLTLATSAVAGGAAPEAPKKVAVEEVTATAVQLTWRDRSVNEVSFEVWSREDGGAEWTRQGSVGSNVTSFIAKDLLRATTYEFRVEAVNPSGSTAAETVLATTLE
jgi:hypothetical protein